MSNFEISCQYNISKVNAHQQVRDKMLELIDFADFSSPFFPSAEVNITKTDWNHATSGDREWVKYFSKYFTDVIHQSVKQLGYSGYEINELWFQQYVNHGEHGWHVHGSNFTAVYYLELPLDSPRTELFEPHTKRRFTLNVNEGDLVIFPGFILHKAGKNRSVHRKTIISFNLNVFYSDDIYGIGIPEEVIRYGGSN